VPAPATPARSAARKVAQLGQALVLSALAVFAVVLLLVDAGPHVLPFETMVVQSGSMRPTLPVGSVVIYRHESASKVKVGQVILFAAPSGTAALVSHRVYAIVDGPKGKYFVTKGDANPEPDNWRIAAVGSGWYAVADVPVLGYALRAIEEPNTKFLLIVVPACLIGLLTLSDMALARRRRRLAGPPTEVAPGPSA
jgi:signal peptidase